MPQVLDNPGEFHPKELIPTMDHQALRKEAMVGGHGVVLPAPKELGIAHRGDKLGRDVVGFRWRKAKANVEVLNPTGDRAVRWAGIQDGPDSGQIDATKNVG